MLNTHHQQARDEAPLWSLAAASDSGTWPNASGSPSSSTFPCTSPSHSKHWIIVSSTSPFTVILGTPPHLPPPSASSHSLGVPDPLPSVALTPVISAPRTDEAIVQHSLIDGHNESLEALFDNCVRTLKQLPLNDEEDAVKYLTSFIASLAKSPTFPIVHKPFTSEDASQPKWLRHEMRAKTAFFDAVIELLERVRIVMPPRLYTRRLIAKALQRFCGNVTTVQNWASRVAKRMPKIRQQSGWSKKKKRNTNTNNTNKRKRTVIDLVSESVSSDDEMPALKAPRLENDE